MTAEFFQYKIEKNEYLAQDEDLCKSYELLLKDCEDLKYLMERFSEELYVILSIAFFEFNLKKFTETKAHN